MTFEKWPCDLCVNIYSIHGNVCHVYIVCHVHIYTCVYVVWIILTSSCSLSASQLGPPLDIPLPSGPACSPATLPCLHRPTWIQGVSEDQRVHERKILWREKNRDFESKGIDLYPPGGVTMGRGREWDLPERNNSRNHSRKYSRELWEVISLSFMF